MQLTLEQTIREIEAGKLLHIAGAEKLLRLLPEGNWIGGSTEHFLTEEGGTVTDKLLNVVTLPFEEYRISSYDVDTIEHITADVYGNGLTIVVLPFNSDVHTKYALDSDEFEDFFTNAICGWISGYNIVSDRHVAVTANGKAGEISETDAVALHIGLPDGKTAKIDMINIFEPDMEKPVVIFKGDSLDVNRCIVDGEEVNFAQYLRESNINTNLPLVGDYSGTGVNISFRDISTNMVHLYAPVKAGVEYRFARDLEDYEGAFKDKLTSIDHKEYIFACNCILNFVNGRMRGKDIGGLYGPVTFGEVAWKVVNQTLVYAVVS
ncbi:MAG: hypothetical protein LBS67_05290 [Clostridiales Family XIII bacterium]|jgi:hypothetical protein|nr:hypothetical protein [Clostridiales Family XIII bacterium]